MSMMNFHLQLPHKQAILFDGKLMKLMGRGRDKHRSMIFMGDDGIPETLTDAEFIEFQTVRRLELLTEAEVEELEAEPRKLPRITLQTCSEKDADEAMRRYAYCLAWEKAGEVARTAKRIYPITVSVAAELEEKCPNARTVLRWIRWWVMSGRNINALIPQYENMGNTTDKLHPKAREILSGIVDEYYLVDTRPSGISVHKHVKKAFREYNAPLPMDARLKVPSLDAVYREIDRLDSYTKDFCRLGKRAAHHKWRAVGSGPVAEQHNEAWEIDHTRIDTVVTDEILGLVVYRPWVTVILDRHSRVVVGFFVSFEAPGLYPVIQALRNAIAPKDELMAKNPTLTVSWPCFGPPRLLVTDQGREFKSRSFREICLQLGIDVQHSPILKPWYKGRIERFFRTLTRNVFQRVPGTTFSNVFERNAEIPPESVAVCSLDELRFHILQWITEVYHRTSHRTLGDTPLNLWNRSVAKHGMLPPPNPARLEEVLTLIDERVPQRQGIQYEGLFYNNPELALFRSRADRPRTVKIAPIWDDLTRIRWMDPEDGKWRDAPILKAQRHLVEGRTLEMHKLARALMRDNEEIGDDLIQAYTYLDNAMKAKSGASGKANRVKAAKYRDAINRRFEQTQQAPVVDVEASGQSFADFIDQGETIPNAEEPAAADGFGIAAPADADGAPLDGNLTVHIGDD
ncbi:MAG: Mu transposase/integrase [Stygiobacter sp.]|nr:MAG: Mu transposase/integrase [Stygiobacter sp.]